jgi:hypothetical protein
MRRSTLRPTLLAFVALSAVTGADAADILVTSFDDYAAANLSGQLAWIGVGGTWATSGSVNAPFTAAQVIGAGVQPGIDPFGGTGRMVRICTEKFNAGRTKAWLDLANSGKWAAASTGGNGVLETSFRLFIPSGQALASGFGCVVMKSSFEHTAGFVVNAQSGTVSLLSGGYAIANRTATSVTVPFNAWNLFSYRWEPATGKGELFVNGVSVATHTTATATGIYASNLLAVTDATPGTANAFGFFDALALRAISPAPPPPACPADLNGDTSVDGQDLGLLLGAWGLSGVPADLNGDGPVDGQDLGVLLGAWGPCS